MSGEFGEYSPGYFWAKMEQAAADLHCGSDALTREWAPFFEEFQHIAKAISWSEASDSSPAWAIQETINRLPDLRESLEKVQRFVNPYIQVSQLAVEEALKRREETCRPSTSEPSSRQS